MARVMSTAVLHTCLNALKSSGQDVTFYLPKKRQWVSFDYKGLRKIRGQIVDGPILVTFSEHESCWVIWVKPSNDNDPKIDKVVTKEKLVAIREEDIRTIV